MTLISVYRLEHAERRVGPYRDLGFKALPIPQLPGFLEDITITLQEQLQNAHLNRAHPCPWRQGEPWAEFGSVSETPYSVMCEKFGFLYLDDLKRWFDGWFSILGFHGYIIKEYLIPEANIRLGNHQISFDENYPIS